MSGGFHYGPPPVETVVGSRDLMLSQYVAALCALVGVEVAEVMGRGRTAQLVTVRHIAQAVARIEREYLLMEVGAFFNRDHTSVVHAVKSVRHFVDHPHNATDFFHKTLQAAEAASLSVFHQPFRTLIPKHKTQ